MYRSCKYLFGGNSIIGRHADLDSATATAVASTIGLGDNLVATGATIIVESNGTKRSVPIKTVVKKPAVKGKNSNTYGRFTNRPVLV